MSTLIADKAPPVALLSGPTSFSSTPLADDAEDLGSAPCAPIRWKNESILVLLFGEASTSTVDEARSLSTPSEFVSLDVGKHSDPALTIVFAVAFSVDTSFSRLNANAGLEVSAGVKDLGAISIDNPSSPYLFCAEVDGSGRDGGAKAESKSPLIGENL